MSRTSRIGVGDCVVTPSLNLIECGQQQTKLAPRTMDLLVYFMQHAGQVISVDELIEHVWHGRLVNTTQIYKGVSQLRSILSRHTGNRHVIETVPKRGYRLLAPVTYLEPAAELLQTQSSNGVLFPRRSRWLGIAATGLLLALIAGIFAAMSVFRSGEPSGPTNAAAVFGGSAGPRAVALLPFTSLSRDPEDANFAAGLHEEVLDQLTKIDSLQVKSLYLVSRYSETDQPLADIARELVVDAVATGSVRNAAGRVSVAIEVIDARTGMQLSALAHEGDIKDIFTLRTDIVVALAEALQREISEPQRLRLRERPTDSPEAYELYLRAGTTEMVPGLPAASRHLYLDRALRLDPEFADAHARKANIYALSLVDNSAVGPAGFHDSARLAELTRSHALKALELDPTATHAHLALALLNQYFWRWTEAKHAYAEAYLLSPNDPQVLRAYSHFSSYTGHHQQAVTMAKRAIEIDPVNPSLHFRLGTVLLNAKESDTAADSFTAAISLDSAYTIAHIFLGILEASRGNREEASTELEVAELLLRPDPMPDQLALIAYGYSRMGRTSDVERVIGLFDRQSEARHVGPGSRILISLALHDVPDALGWLNSIVERIESNRPDVSYYNLMLLRANAFSDETLDEPEFAAVRASLGRLRLSQAD